MPSILIINPNSSVSITDVLKEVVDPAPDFTYKFFTAPYGPAEIDSYSASIESTAACTQALLAVLDQHDAFLIACYSDHPLIQILREHTKKPVLGIFQASVLQALALGADKFGIVTTNTVWERLLDSAVLNMLGSHARYAGAFTTNLGVLELQDLSEELVHQQIVEASLEATSKGASCVLLGSAGMAGMGEAVKKAVGDKVRVIDGVIAGTEILVGLVRSLS
jgi:Asp/Glu/hydantoin racemase